MVIDIIVIGVFILLTMFIASLIQINDSDAGVMFGFVMLWNFGVYLIAGIFSIVFILIYGGIRWW